MVVIYHLFSEYLIQYYFHCFMLLRLLEYEMLKMGYRLNKSITSTSKHVYLISTISTVKFSIFCILVEYSTCARNMILKMMTTLKAIIFLENNLDAILVIRR